MSVRVRVRKRWRWKLVASRDKAPRGERKEK